MTDDMKAELAVRKESNRIKMYDALAKRDGAGDRLEAEAIRNADQPVGRLDKLVQVIWERNYRIERDSSMEMDLSL